MLSSKEISDFLSGLNKKITSAFSSEWKTLRTDISKQVRYLKQDIVGKKASKEDKADLLIKLLNGDTSALDRSPYQRERDELQAKIDNINKQKEMEQRIKTEIPDPEKQKDALEILKSYKDAESTAKNLSANTKDLEKIFNSAIDKMIDGSKDFNEIMEDVFVQLKQYFVKAILDAVMNGIVSSAIGERITGALNGVGNFAGNAIGSGISGIFNIIGSFFGAHHSGGYIPSGTGNLPGTAEYLSVLKGGERVLSPSENSALNNGQNPNNLVVNNFNIQSWDSKDVQQYLLSNKSLIAKITAENIKYNNSNLRYMVGNY